MSSEFEKFLIERRRAKMKLPPEAYEKDIRVKVKADGSMYWKSYYLGRVPPEVIRRIFA